MLSENALKLLKDKKYFKDGESSWEDICERVSVAIADAEVDPNKKTEVQKEIFESMNNLEFIFSTPCLLNADINNPGQLSSCFVIPVKDDLKSIFECLGEFAQIFQKNGGAGTNLSSLRPSGSPLQTSGGCSSGVVGFMSGFDWVADELTKNNKARKGAVKIDLAVWHPDILEFISCKHSGDNLFRMNISVAVDDEFMIAVEKDEYWYLMFPDFSWNKEIYNNEWDGNIYEWIKKGYPIIEYKKIKARELLDKIAYEAWYSGEPGISYQSAMNKGNMNKHLYSSVFGNPCHEFVNIPYSSCNLGSPNLIKFVKDGKFDFDKLKDQIYKYVRWMDNLITINKLPLDRINNITNGIRPIGIGTMGFGELLYLLKIKYNSKEGYDFADKLYSFILKTTIEASQEIAKERGVFPLYANSEWDKNNIKIRNSSLLSIAPNGTIATIANTSGGIEPVFSLTYSRRTNEGNLYYYTNKIFEDELIKLGIYSEELMQKIEKNHGSCQGIKEIPKDIQDIFVTAHDIKPQEHIKMVGVIQKHVDLSISKTANFSNNATVDNIKETIISAWKNGCKGITVYRDGSRDNQTLATTREDSNINNLKEITFDSIDPIDKDDLGETYGTSIKKRVACGNLFIQLFRDENGNLAEMFINTSKSGICQSNINAISRLVSIGLRSGIKVEYLCDQLIGIKCPACTVLKSKGEQVEASCAEAIGRYILDKYKQGEVSIKECKVKQKKSKQTKRDDKTKCPNCGEKLRMESGCVICQCGFSKCG